MGERVDRRLETRLAHYPDVRVRPVTAADGVAEFVAGSEQPIQLAVVGGVDVGKILRLVGPVGPSIFDHADCSVLVVRQ